jgi:hypothetical protein
LVKAFVTVHQDLLCAVLKKYGLPNALVQNIAKLYKNCIVKIKVGRGYTDVDYTTGVHQGDNMSPVLFLFIIQAFLDTLQLDDQPVDFAYFPENKNGKTETAKGRLINQNTSEKGVTFNLQSSFYVDDRFFGFQNRNELYEAANVLNPHFTRFGLTMHLESNTLKSKLGAMFFSCIPQGG